MASIEELVFELAEEHTSGNLEKLIRLLDLVLNGKKALEAAPVSEPSPEAKKAPAKKAAAKAAPAKVVEEAPEPSPDPSQEFDPDEF